MQHPPVNTTSEAVDSPSKEKERARIELKNGGLSAPITASALTGALSGAPHRYALWSEFSLESTLMNGGGSLFLYAQLRDLKKAGLS